MSKNSPGLASVRQAASSAPKEKRSFEKLAKLGAPGLLTDGFSQSIKIGIHYNVSPLRSKGVPSENSITFLSLRLRVIKGLLD